MIRRWLAGLLLLLLVLRGVPKERLRRLALLLLAKSREERWLGPRLSCLTSRDGWLGISSGRCGGVERSWGLLLCKHGVLQYVLVRRHEQLRDRGSIGATYLDTGLK